MALGRERGRRYLLFTFFSVASLALGTIIHLIVDHLRLIEPIHYVVDPLLNTDLNLGFEVGPLSHLFNLLLAMKTDLAGGHITGLMQIFPHGVNHIDIIQLVTLKTAQWRKIRVPQCYWLLPAGNNLGSKPRECSR